MATVETTLIYREADGSFLNFKSSNGNSFTLARGQSIEISFRNIADSSNTCSILQTETAKWGDFDGVNPVSDGGSRTFTVASNAATGTTFINANCNGRALSLTITIVATADTTPTNWSFPSTYASRPGSYETIKKEISGVNTPITVSCSSGCEVKKGYSDWTGATSITGVQNGDDVWFRSLVPGDYNQSLSRTLTAGSSSASWTIYTGDSPDPNDGAKIPSGLSRPLNLSDVGNFFGRSNAPNTTLSEYVKGGSFVPTIDENSSVPSSPPINLLDLEGAYTAIYFKLPPINKADSKNILSQSQSIVLTWVGGSNDFDMGFGNNIIDELQFRINITPIQGGTPNCSVPLNTWSTYHSTFNISATANAGQELIMRGHITISARSPSYPSAVVSADVYYFMNFYGV